ncbi:MAG TPA: hypothetical protein VMY41_16925 [Thermohalobaculum sp.]|nr:hypothetical protein [Thermohalobaculum sp.]
MGTTVDFLQRYLAPFVAGVYMAGATVVHDVPSVVALILAGSLCGFFSFPAGGRVIRRISGLPV